MHGKGSFNSAEAKCEFLHRFLCFFSVEGFPRVPSFLHRSIMWQFPFFASVSIFHKKRWGFVFLMYSQHTARRDTWPKYLCALHSISLNSSPLLLSEEEKVAAIRFPQLRNCPYWENGKEIHEPSLQASSRILEWFVWKTWQVLSFLRFLPSGVNFNCTRELRPADVMPKRNIRKCFSIMRLSHVWTRSCDFRTYIIAISAALPHSYGRRITS